MNSAVKNPQGPELVSKLVANATKKKAPIDLRSFQTELLKRQLAVRNPRIAREAAKARVNLHKLRVRQNTVGDCVIADTGADRARNRLYFELSNGQVVRADRAAQRPGFGRRKVLLQNPRLVARIKTAVEANTTRKAA